MERLLFFIVILVLAQSCQQNKVPISVETEISAIRQIFAPDKRVALLDIEPRMENGQLVLAGESNLPIALDSLKSRLDKLGLSPKMEVQLLPEDSLKGYHYGIVRPAACNLRSKRGHSQELATQATLGTPLSILKEEEHWYLVQTPDGYLAWLDNGGFVPMKADEFQAWQAAKKVVYLPDFGFSLAEPHEDAARVSDLLAGNILLDLGEDGGFTKVGYPDGRTAYLPSSTLMNYTSWLESRKPSPENIIATAKTMIGRPYLWGGTSGKAMDCSGFTKTTFYLNGLQLPRDASQQVHTGIEVSTDSNLTNLQAGDLLFFGRKATLELKERITHVGIYLGEGRMIHAGADNGGIKIESLRPGDPDFAAHRLETFVRAKRLLDAPGENGTRWLGELEGY
ncbi:MAG: cytochrome c [Saprospiraceae bacterium]|nr:MAG: cytochrome c [Saprospiraceae bacterium]